MGSDTIQQDVKENVRVKESAAGPVRNFVKPEDFENKEVRVYRGNRALDVIFGSIGVLLYGLIYPFIALGIKLGSPGPVIFKQKRTGQDGEVFHCHKFRTMHVVDKTRQNGKPVITERGDSRIFGFGQLLRKLNLDELPQIINVLKGDMSLVGPRPYPVDECAYWNDVFDDHHLRYMVKPGVSGLAQVKGYRGGTLDEEHMRTRLNYDLIYIEKNSVSIDLYVIGKTVLQMVTRQTNGH